MLLEGAMRRLGGTGEGVPDTMRQLDIGGIGAVGRGKQRHGAILAITERPRQVDGNGAERDGTAGAVAEIEGEAADAAAAEKARKALYGQAARECTVLTASFSGTACTLENLNIMFQRDNSMNRNSSVLSGNAVYQLRAD